MAHLRIKVNGTVLPSPTNIESGDEQIWSASTGRSTSTGEMLGAFIVEKQTYDIEWSWVTRAEYNAIKSALKTGFFGPVVLEDSNSQKVESITNAYRGPISRTNGNYIGGILYYEKVKVQIIEK